MLGKITEGHYKFVFNGSGVISDGSDELLDAEIAGVIDRRAGGSLWVLLNLYSIGDRCVTVRVVMSFFGGGLVELGAEIGNVVVHCEAAGALIIVPLEIDSNIEVSFLID